MKANINHYRTFVKDGVINEVPIADEESRVLMEMNYMQYVNLLADIVTKTSNINTSSSSNDTKKYGLCSLRFIA